MNDIWRACVINQGEAAVPSPSVYRVVYSQAVPSTMKLFTMPLMSVEAFAKVTVLATGASELATSMEMPASAGTSASFQDVVIQAVMLCCASGTASFMANSSLSVLSSPFPL